MTNIRTALFLLLLLAHGVPVPAVMAQSGLPLSVLRVSPSGEDVPRGRQIVFQFNRAVVALGHMARRPHEIPVRIKPRLDCQWRWLDQSALPIFPADIRKANFQN